DDKSNETKQQPLPLTAGNKVKSGQGNAHPQQQAAEEPKRRLLRRNTLAHRPPKAAKENGAQQHARQQCQRQQQNLIHRHPPVRLAWLCLLSLPSATDLSSRARARPQTAPASRHACPESDGPATDRALPRARSELPLTRYTATTCRSRTP